MKINLLLKAACAATLVSMTATPAVAGPENKAPNGAMPEKGTGCIVRGAEDQAYQPDADCSFRVVNKRNADGLLIFQVYQDKGTLQAGQEIDGAFQFSDNFMIGPFDCHLVETATPSGQYSSFQHCRRAE